MPNVAPVHRFPPALPCCSCLAGGKMEKNLARARVQSSATMEPEPCRLHPALPSSVPPMSGTLPSVPGFPQANRSPPPTPLQQREGRANSLRGLGKVNSLVVLGAIELAAAAQHSGEEPDLNAAEQACLAGGGRRRRRGTAGTSLACCRPCLKINPGF
ncbi:hypothetical protein GGTG_07029 [Gaeumannomyces tritici R3-111a-1]|uniref:Uncharacterized protein n=1 Tax=Gaeumannomyces tritici (strain R3-111a-1) TaxID=644352 RepID=J3P0I4_GAET3|nr:hypothetical protein GGTG_07029 [Gaeumannomyces tritici R3-111a-1]EJT77117.1 hypothetical protein GGTG_07029 [Gaeumannomyces tritici R3-111a-1]